MAIKKKNILILGGTGFIGRNLVEELSKIKNFKVFASYHKRKKFNNKNVTWVKANLKNKKKIDNILKNKDIIIQAAAVTTSSKDVINRPYIHVTDNIIINTLLLRSAFENNIKHFIFFSCTVMYNSSNVKHDEKSKNIVKEDSPYFGVGNMKMYIEKQALFYSKLKRTKFTILRHSNIYGPHDKFDENSAHVLPNFLNKALNEKKIFSIWGNGKSVRDFLYIDDLINCIKIIIAKQKSNYEIFNVGSNNPITILQLAKIILKVVKRKKIIKYVNKSFSIDNKIKISNKKINSLNWRPKYSLELGVRKTINWLKASNK